MQTAIEKPIPVLVLSGFLGSGKTTLVCHLLQAAQTSGERVAVISNEFGALGIDQTLFGEGKGAYVELEGGCVCCQLSDELHKTLQMLRERVHPDYIIVETSGVALPSDTQLQFWREPVCQWVEDDVAVVVVNAEQVHEHRDLYGTFEDQVSSADLLLLNKIDLVPTAILPQLESLLHTMAPDTPILRCQNGQVDPSVLFPPDPDGSRAQRRGSNAAPQPHGHETFVAQELAIADGIDTTTLMHRIRQLDPLRAKGFVRTADGLRLIQGVGRRLELTVPATVPPARLIGRVVVIRRA